MRATAFMTCARETGSVDPPDLSFRTRVRCQLETRFALSSAPVSSRTELTGSSRRGEESMLSRD